METQDLRAFSVHADDDHTGSGESDVVFATSPVAAAATYESANGLSGGEIDPDWVRRSPEFDRFAPGPVPPKAMIEAGWRIECSFCLRELSSDDEDEIGPLPNLADMVEDGEDLFCDSGCHSSCAAAGAETLRIIIEARAAALAAWPGIEVHEVVLLDDSEIRVLFTFPGCQGHKAYWRQGADHVMVHPDTLEAWTQLRTRMPA